MRSDEMLLNAAEACAHQGKDTEAKALLWQLQDLRNAKRTEASGDELIEAILKERRNSFFLKEILIAWFQKSKIYPFYVKNIRNKRLNVKNQKKLAEKHCTNRIIQGSCLIFSKDFIESNEKNILARNNILC